MNLGEILKRLRIEKGMTQQELGNIIGKSKQMIINYEKNKNNIPMDVLQDIATALNTTVESIVISGTNKKQEINNSIKNIGIFLSFFDCVLLPDSTENKIIFLDGENKKCTLNSTDFSSLLKFLKSDFKEWLSRIILIKYLENKDKTKIDVNEIYNLIFELAKKPTFDNTSNDSNIDVIDVFSKVGKEPIK